MGLLSGKGWPQTGTKNPGGGRKARWMGMEVWYRLLRGQGPGPCDFFSFQECRGGRQLGVCEVDLGSCGW